MPARDCSAGAILRPSRHATRRVLPIRDSRPSHRGFAPAGDEGNDLRLSRPRVAKHARFEEPFAPAFVPDANQFEVDPSNLKSSAPGTCVRSHVVEPFVASTPITEPTPGSGTDGSSPTPRTRGTITMSRS